MQYIVAVSAGTCLWCVCAGRRGLASPHRKKYSMNLTDFIASYHELSDSERALMAENVSCKTIASKEFFVESGKRSNEIGFIEAGVFRYFFYDAEGREITSHFMADNELVGNVQSFFEYAPSSGSIQALTECRLTLIDREAWDLFTQEIPHWEATIQKIINEVLMRKTRFQRSLINADAQKAYLNFLATYPAVARCAPLNHIASFLGITPFSLSRIRKTMAAL